MSSKEDRDRYWGDMLYEVWRNGGNSDAVDRDEAREYMDAGYWPEEAAEKFCRQAEQEQPEMEQQAEQECPAEPEPEAR